MSAPKSLLNVMHEIESELMEFCNYDYSKKLVDLIKKHRCGFSIKSQEKDFLWIAYENVYIALHRDNHNPHISFATSGNDNTSEEKRFNQDEKVLTHLLRDLEKLKK